MCVVLTRSQISLQKLRLGSDVSAGQFRKPSDYPYCESAKQ
jgi:hypothetical protein